MEAQLQGLVAKAARLHTQPPVLLARPCPHPCGVTVNRAGSGYTCSQVPAAPHLCYSVSSLEKRALVMHRLQRREDVTHNTLCKEHQRFASAVSTHALSFCNAMCSAPKPPLPSGSLLSSLLFCACLVLEATQPTGLRPGVPALVSHCRTTEFSKGRASWPTWHPEVRT